MDMAKPKRGPYKSKNRLDGFLRFALPIKYKWRRYEIYKEFLRQKCCCSDAQIDDIVADRMENGVNGENYQATLDGLKNWLKECRVKRAKNAAAVRHKKIRK